MKLLKYYSINIYKVLLQLGRSSKYEYYFKFSTQQYYI